MDRFNSHPGINGSRLLVYLQEDVEQFETKNRELREVVRTKENQIQTLERTNEDLENKLQEAQERKEKETQNSELQEEIHDFKDRIR